MPGLTRGPLPPRVYWARRLMVFATAVLLVFGIARLLNDGSDASGGQARLAADESPTASVSTAESFTTPTQSDVRRHRTATPTPTPTPTLAAPEGTCDSADVAVTPKVTNAVAGRDVTVVLQLRTLESPACTWHSDRKTLTVDITSGSDQIWSSRQCPRAIPVRDVVVRKDVTTNVPLVWDEARRSDDECSRLAGWAMPGWYHVTAAAVGGEPSDLQFELHTPSAATVTKTAKPTQSPSRTPTQSPSRKPTQSPSRTPSAG